MWYGGRLFRPIKSSKSSETTTDTIFKYEQVGDMVTATYSGGQVRYGHLIGQVRPDGKLDMRYHHMDRMGQLRTGVCLTTPEVLDSGRLRLHEDWQWTCGSHSKGQSVLEEI
ncbi:n-acetylglutamate synthase [Litorimonas sp. WD9-15]|uniref:n-acetylglutamate synthase n=1 Tax=Litorimonas sp. WD9-15 TaxID=3418716 RepID=UPI003CFD2160